MFKDVLQEMLESELEVELGYSKGDKKNKQTDNRRNGHSEKKVKTQYGEMTIEVPRDRDGEFEPVVVPKNKRDISGIEDKVISLYARGMSTRDIHNQLKDIYGIELSAEMVSKITDSLLPQIKEWQHRPLESVYPFVLYLASQNATKKWKQRYRNWDLILNQLMIFFEARIEKYL